MRIVRYDDGANVRFGDLRGGEIRPLDGDLAALAPADAAPVPLSAVTLRMPVVPGKIVAVGPNYRAHLKGNPPPPRPYYWIKPATALLDPEGVIELPTDVPMVCHESELAIVIGRTTKKVSPAEAPAHILGYTCINDVSAGNMIDIPAYVASPYFVDGKIYDTFAPLGPVVVTDLDPSDLNVRCRVNGDTRQDHRTSDMIWQPAELVSLISQVLTLHPGDVIATGSPPGVGPLQPGDVVEVEVEGIGVLRNTTV